MGGGSSRGSADVSRTMFDVLSHIAPIVPPKQPQQKDQQQQQQSPLADLQSWCGAAEVRRCIACSNTATCCWPMQQHTLARRPLRACSQPLAVAAKLKKQSLDCNSCTQPQAACRPCLLW